MTSRSIKSPRPARRDVRDRLTMSAAESVLALVFQPLHSPMLLMSDSQVVENVLPFELLEMFKLANKASLNTSIVESSNELQIVGWIAPYTLLVSASKECLDVIKSAWSRRTLRSPSQFALVETAIVKEFALESIPRSQFLPLSSTLYDCIRELDKMGQSTSRDSIIKYLKNVYHNVKIPPDSVIHRCLGKLIEQRDIYHNGVGYHALIDSSPFKHYGIVEKRVVKKNDVCDTSTNNSTTKQHNLILEGTTNATNDKNLKPDLQKDRKKKKSYYRETKSMDVKSDAMAKGKGKNRHSRLQQDVVVSHHNFTENGQEIKIIDISAEASIIQMSSNVRSSRHKQKTGPESIMDTNNNRGKDRSPSTKHCPKNEQLLHSCKIKLHRSRSFSSRTSEKTRNGNEGSVSSTDSDFPLRRAMAEEELRFFLYDMKNNST